MKAAPGADNASMRLLRISTILGGLVMLVVSVLLVNSNSRDDRLQDLTLELAAQADTEAARIDEYFERSAAIVQQLSENPAFRSFYESDEEISRAAALVEVNRALGFLERLYPDSIGEACFIDRRGWENARVVRGLVADADDLSLEETEAPFFAPTFGLPVGDVYQTEPYRSPDTAEWVIANSTLVPVGGGSRPALVHFEVTVDSFRQTQSGQVGRVRIVDRSGLVVIDSAAPQVPDAALGWPEQSDFADLARTDTLSPAGARDVVEISDGVYAAIHPLTSRSVTPNQWFVAVTAAEPGSGLAASLTTSIVAVVIGGILVLALAIGSMIAHERRLQHLATTDSLTGLVNRAVFAERVAHALRSVHRADSQIAVLLIDLDRFKEVNDTLGHQYGDQLLCELAVRLSAAVRPTDIVARLGGDEFAVLLSPTNGDENAVAAASRISKALGSQTTINGVPYHVEASIGIAMAPQHGGTVAELLQHADVAMYCAKRAGVPHQVYHSDHDPNTEERLSTIAELRDGIGRGELVNHYQPKFRLDTMEIVGVEALVRWHHPTRGIVPPGEFIPLAEFSGLLRPLTNEVMRLAFAQIAEWTAAGHDITMAVNISSRTLADAEFPVDLMSALDQSGALPHSIVLEITESSLIGEMEASSGVLGSLRDRGFTISLDDFGTGYSSLEYVRNLPVDELKIDRRFVMRLLDSKVDRTIVGSTIEMALALGYTVVAEGIEDEGVLDLVREMGATMAQGFLLGHPGPAQSLDLCACAPTQRVIAGIG